MHASTLAPTLGDHVKLNVYDLVLLAKDNKLDALGMGVYHTGLEVHGHEYAFGGGLLATLLVSKM